MFHLCALDVLRQIFEAETRMTRNKNGGGAIEVVSNGLTLKAGIVSVATTNGRQLTCF